VSGCMNQFENMLSVDKSVRDYYLSTLDALNLGEK
jgi:hypothetical protein